MAADPNKILVTMTPDTLAVLDSLAMEDALNLDRRVDRSATLRDLIRAENTRRNKIRKKSSRTA